MYDDKKDPERPHRIAEKAREISDFLGKRQRYHAERAQDFGYSKEIFKGISSSYDVLSDNPAYSATEESLNKFHEFMRAREAQADALRFDVSSASYAVASTASSTASVVIIGAGDTQTRTRKGLSLIPPPNWTRDRVYLYASKLEGLDSELGRLARSVWQSCYSGTDSAERTSLFSIRQLYDHFFSILAPDEDVRKSEIFKVKDGKEPNQVHRKERLLYAASTRVRDTALGDVLASEADQVLETYERLNQLHKRGALDPYTARNALASMQAVIEQWVDAIGL